MIDNTQIHSPQKYICFYPEDLQMMASETLSYGNIEHGFSLFGFSTHGENLVCMFVVSAGPKATRQVANFHDDPEYIMEIGCFLYSCYGFQYIGNAHSHHDLGLCSPSGTDQNQINQVSRKNNIRSLGQIIITYEYYDQGNCQYFAEDDCKPKFWFKKANSQKNDNRFVKFNSYIYQNAQAGGYKPMMIKLLEGSNPIRQQLSKNDIFESNEMKDEPSFPIERIIIDQYPTNSEHDKDSKLPDILSDKLKNLSEDNLANAEMHIKESYFIISIPIREHFVLIATYSIEKKCPLKKIVLNNEQQSTDLTKDIIKSIKTDDMAAVFDSVSELIQE